ncbi:YqfO family protein [Vibrio vulnificus]|uniref:hypothetical protein n=2 Tax=Vibrio vulnificus TaxID=672 RepID=UPI002B45FAA3|nr:hypothetical protein [Vibrio vulnificus]
MAFLLCVGFCGYGVMQKVCSTVVCPLSGRYVFWEKMMEFKLEIYAPETEVVAIRDALNSVGAGVVGVYDSVISIVKISGFWRPTEGSEPVTGEKGEINFGEEVRIDVRCQESLVQAALDAIRRIHPYEEPVINILPLYNHKFV